MGVEWNTNFMRTMPGMVMAGQVVLALIGAIISLITSTALHAFAFWSTLIISGVFLLLHICNLMQTIEAKFPLITRVQLGYVGVWTILYIIVSIVSFFGFAISAILVYAILIVFLIDLFIRYREYRSGSGPNATASNPAAAAASGGETGVPKY